MDARTIKFICMAVFSIGCIAGGYFARKKNLVHEDFSRKLHFHTVLWFWSLGGVLVIWPLPLSPALFWLLVVVPVAMLVATYSTVFACRLFNFTKSQTGVLAVGACISNTGMTLGAYLCYRILSHKTENEALAYANATCYIMLLFAIPIVYPIAQSCGHVDGPRKSPLKLLIDSLIDIRSIGMSTGCLGLALSALKVPYPQVIWDYHILDVLAYFTAFGGYFGIGLRLRLGDSLAFMPQHALLAVVKFIATPVATLLMILALDHFLGDSAPTALMNHVMLIQSSVAAGTSIVIVSNVFHLDARMASVLWIWNTLFFLLLVVPIWMVVTRVYGW